MIAIVTIAASAIHAGECQFGPGAEYAECYLTCGPGAVHVDTIGVSTRVALECANEIVYCWTVGSVRPTADAAVPVHGTACSAGTQFSGGGSCKCFAGAPYDNSAYLMARCNCSD
ncbi:MAG: hypothetical protein ACREQY_03030 [Candidatus Binatia bacterium]